MASSSRATVAAAAGLTLLGGAAFVSAPTGRAGNLRATVSAATPAFAPVSGPEASSVASMAVASAAVATCFASRKAAANAKHQLVALSAFENELGVQAPVGFWDPAGFAADGSTENFARRRQTELKHGRISMLATMGYITPEITGKFPGYLSPSAGLKFADVPNGLAAISKVPAAGWGQILAYMAFCEVSQDQSAGTPAAAGDFGFKVLTASDPEAKKTKLAAELANGRLAMMAIIGMFFQDGLTGSAWGDWANYTASPLRAFENELGVQAPVGFWDPAGFTADGSTENFARRRQTELKHGRISMLATMGYITPEITGKLPGYLSPSAGLKFADVPNGLAAISKVPAAGWGQILAYMAFCEVSQDQSAGTPAAAGDFGFKVLTASDPEAKKTKLAAELANGRLAMMAIIGMFFQDGLTGSAWGDWANYTASPLRAFENELGVQAPVGFWDPAGFTADGSTENFARRRQTELKHGRISMLATMGYITPEITGKLPGYLSPSAGLKFADVPNGLAAISKVPAAGWGQILAYMAFCEVSQDQSAGTPAAAGDFGFKVLTASDPEAKKTKLAAELANGRLAMMAIIGMFFQDGLTGSAWGDWANYTASPLRAFENELGVQAPVGFWDPAGFTADGSTENFARRRQTELKHGRISMLATMGYITPEITGKLPGYLSPSAGLKFADVPNGLAAISKVPAAGWGQILAYMAFCEVSQDQSAGTPAAAGDFGFKVLTASDPEAKKTKLAAELANGRLAMMAIIGMFFQDGLTGSAWGDWANYTASPLRAFENELGVQAPVGFWDPAGFTADGSTENFARRRQTELKHGRISMLATMGYITPEITGKLPGYLSPSAGLKFADVPNGLAAISKVPAAGWGQILAYMAFCEVSQDQSAGTPAAAGDFGFKVLTASDPEAKKTKLAAELANGRLAMMAIIGMFFQDGLTGSAWGDWANYTASPLRAFENELGVQAPVGFWDPAGFTADGSTENFARRRQTELKHGRISMLATMGYITPEITGKLPGYLSPSAGLKFADVPNGLAAISKVPAAGWGQILAYMAFCEVSQDQSAGTPAAAGDFGFKVLTASDPEAKKTKLAAELANGRLAMMAIIGMFFQDGLTGSAWGDWANYTASPLRAFENELGVQAPVGFWDPAGFTADGSTENFARRRQTELKHGRISMLATMGYITPEITGKLPGYLSPSAGLKFADVPNGLAAISKVPAAGWGQILAYMAFCEVSQDQSAGTPAAAGDFGFKVLTASDPEAKKTKLAAELANGRLAMMAIIGMFFQDGLTGSAWGDWANYTASPLRAFENELGVQAPVGFWDPAGFTADGSTENFARRRQTELKHGRISMLATMGYITPEITGKFPGYLSPSAGLKFADVPNGLAAISKVPAAGWGQILAYMAFCEVSQDQSAGTPAAAGDFGFKVLTASDPEAKKTKLAAELANGRLAMMAIIGMFFQDGLTGSAWGDWANYTASPLRAFENELGVQAPVGFWDPAGFTADGSTENFARRRQTELKHGRISMLATMGYITPEITGKFPGYLSPSAGLKFADVPNGLAAISKVPAAGWGQILAYMAYCEVSQDQSAGTPAAAGDFGFKVLTASDPEAKKTKLAAELANGRLAMMAIIGMFFQDGLTGSAWGDWANYTASPLRAFENELGVQAPVGFWDPAGFTADGSTENFARRRQTELKHGRISMLATMGYITPEITGKLPGYLSPSAGLKFADVPNGLAAISKVPAAGWGQILAYMAYCEVSQDQSAGTPAAAGDFGFKVLTASDPEAKKTKLAAELANGRLAMMAIIGMFFQDGLTGSAWGDWANYTASPLRAFENELGVQAPVGFWDPAGFTADGSTENFARRRQTELKHGRISMLATMGYITPEITGKFPGYLSPSAGLKFADVPNGLAAISKVPAAGWGQILAYMAYCEVSQDQSAGTPAAAGDFGFKVLTASDPEEAPGVTGPTTPPRRCAPSRMSLGCRLLWDSGIPPDLRQMAAPRTLRADARRS
ncbi:unnamed protein product [Effrenium voratum]|nr:unnamed protein product [Effrenium voratum]